MSTSRRSRLARGAWLLTAALAACQNSGADLGFGPPATSVILVGVYFDRDGSRTQTAGVDTVFARARVALLGQGTNDTLRTVLTDNAGLARFDGVPVGEYRIAVDPASIGDSIVVAAIDSAHVVLKASTATQGVVVRLAYPEVSIRQARALPFGKRAFIRAVILAGVQSFSDTTSHVADTSGQIRLTRVNLKGGLTGNAPGDSVSVIGTASVRAGQPTLDLALVAKFGQRPPPVPVPLNTAQAATANGGVLDAALVQVSAIVSDSATVAPHFRVTASDGTGSLNIILDGLQNFPRSAFRVGRSITVKGVLVPDGQGSWNLKPRDPNDIFFNN
jgi:hypothetical protein